MTEPNALDLLLEDYAAVLACLPLQDISMGIWKKKYQLVDMAGNPVDVNITEMQERVARALADVETTSKKKKKWYKEFLWAMKNGAVPAGRINANAGAKKYKPATSVVNCVVSGTIQDSMTSILGKVHEAGITLKAGCGIGYEFSTLRPKGAYVAGAGATTSGPLSFMDISDRMCFTVRSAGGRRGAQMGTFDVQHPDVYEFIRVKREDGRLRQFNLSLLITDDFVNAVKNKEPWSLGFPMTEEEIIESGIDLDDESKVFWREWATTDEYVVNDKGEVACRIYEVVEAAHLWDTIMAATYDYAEPGFLLIDKYNNMNNNWAFENIRASNPSLRGEELVYTSLGITELKDLEGKKFQCKAPSGKWLDADCIKTGTDKELLRLDFGNKRTIDSTPDHKWPVVRKDGSYMRVRADELKAGDYIMRNRNEYLEFCNDSSYTYVDGVVAGLLFGDGWFDKRTDDGRWYIGIESGDIRTVTAVAEYFNTKVTSKETTYVTQITKSDVVLDFLTKVNMFDKADLPSTVWDKSAEFTHGFLDGYFGADGYFDPKRAVLTCKDRQPLVSTRRLLGFMGVSCSVRSERPKPATFPNGKDYGKLYARNTLQCVRSHFDNVVSPFRSNVVPRSNIRRPNRLQLKTISKVEERADTWDIRMYGDEHVFPASYSATGNCGEQGLPEYGACLLGSVNLVCFIVNPFTDSAHVDWDKYRKVVGIFTRMLDNVVEINGLPLKKQRNEIKNKRRHGMGYMGLGSATVMLKQKYGSAGSIQFTTDVTRELAIAGWKQALVLAKEKGCAPILDQIHTVTKSMLLKRPEMVEDGYKVGDDIAGKVLHTTYSRYMQRIAEVEPELVAELAIVGARFTHHSSLAPTGTIALSIGNNVSNGVEPSFSHHYSRNVIEEGKKTKSKEEVYSYELLAYRALVDPEAFPGSEDHDLPDYFVTSDSITPKQHVDVQAAAQYWIDSSISKTINIATDCPYEDFKDVYMYAYDKGLKGCATFRYNPKIFQGVLVKEEDLKNTTYVFTLEDGTDVEFTGDEEVMYDGEKHNAANLYDALKEGYYGKH